MVRSARRPHYHPARATAVAFGRVPVDAPPPVGRAGVSEQVRSREGTFEHVALLHWGADDLARRLAPLVLDSLERREAVLVSVDEPCWQALERSLGGAPAGATYVPATERYTDPAAAIALLASFIGTQQREGATGVLSIGTVPLDGGARDDDWFRYEAAVNEVFSAVPLCGVCLFDMRRLPHGRLRDVTRTHRLLDDGGGPVASRRYTDPRTVSASIPPPSLAPTRPADLRLARQTDPRAARHALADALRGAVDLSLLDDLVLVVSELVANANLHAGTPAGLGLWLEPDAVVVEVRDRGPGLSDPFAPYRPPALSGSAGLWITHQLADRLAIDSSSAGTTVTARLPRSGGSA